MTTRRNHIKIILILCFLVLCSCKHDRKVNEKSLITERTTLYLTGGSEKHWIMAEPTPVLWNNGILYRSDGTYIPYTNSMKHIGERYINRTLYNNWQIKDDSTIIKGIDNLYKIIFINDDIMVLDHIEFKHILVYLKAKDQVTKPIIDTSTLKFKILPR